MLVILTSSAVEMKWTFFMLVVLAVAVYLCCGVDSDSDEDSSCFQWNGVSIENCTVEHYCLLYSDYRCIAQDHLGIGCVYTGMCITYDDTNFLRAGFCPYHPLNMTFCHLPLADFYEIRLSTTLSELNTLMCDPYNREGVLCSRCKSGYGPAVFALVYSVLNVATA